MEALSRSLAPEDRHAGLGCAYILDDGDSCRFCGGVPRRGSSYCPQHHALCHVASGTAEESRRLREVEELARVVGGHETGAKSRACGSKAHARPFGAQFLRWAALARPEDRVYGMS